MCGKNLEDGPELYEKITPVLTPPFADFQVNSLRGCTGSLTLKKMLLSRSILWIGRHKNYNQIDATLF